MEEKIDITAPALRVKTTGLCNRSCSFCHKEGDMATIGNVAASSDFFGAVRSLTDVLDCTRVMLTGGGPTVHPELSEIVSGLAYKEISITSNGIRLKSVDEWRDLRERGLTQIVISIHDASAQDLLSLELAKRNIGWAENALKNQCANIVNASAAGLSVRVNVVVHGTAEQACAVLKMLDDMQIPQGVDVRLLNNLSNLDQSQWEIVRIIEKTAATSEETYRRAGSSNSTTFWTTKDGFRFSTKMAQRYFFDPICDGCSSKERCHEGFYGVRVECRNGGEYWVRLCIYRQDREVLMPLHEFIEGPLPEKLRLVMEDELAV